MALNLVSEDPEERRREERFVRALNQEATTEVRRSELRELTQWATLAVTMASEAPEKLLDQIEHDIRLLSSVESTCSKDFRTLEGDRTRQQILELLTPQLRALPEALRTTRKLAKARPTDLRPRRRQVIAEIAGPIHSYLAECGCEDPNFWTAGVLLVFGRLPLTWMRLKKSTREVAERTPFENLSRWKDGAGEVLARYVQRLLDDSG